MADEIATVSLGRMAQDYKQTRQGSVSAEAVRAILVQFLRSHDWSTCGGSLNVDLGFPLSFQQRDGRATWRVGALGDTPEVLIPAQR